jgi:hypothetical protein
MKIKTLLLCFGLGYLLLFALQGQYMAIFQGGLQSYPDGQRMLLRSAHIYAMLCALPLIFMGQYLPARAALVRVVGRWRLPVSTVVDVYRLFY